MKVKLIVAMSGPDVDHKVGDIIEVTDVQAERLNEAGYIETITTEVKAQVKTVKKSKRKKKRK